MVAGDRQLIEVGAFAAGKLTVVLGAAAVPQPVERLPLACRRLQLLAAAADLLAAGVQVTDGDRAPPRQPLEIGMARGQFGRRLEIATAGCDAAEALARVVDRRVDLPERGLFARLAPERRGQVLLRSALALAADVMNPLEPEPERSFRHAPLIARNAPVFSRTGLEG